MDPSTEMMIFYFQWMFFLTLPLLTGSPLLIPIRTAAKTAAKDVRTANAAVNAAAATKEQPGLKAPEEFPDHRVRAGFLDPRAFLDPPGLWGLRDMSAQPVQPEALEPPALPA